MPGSEWSLVFFTLLAQAGVGALCASEFTRIIINKKKHSKSTYPFVFKTRLLALISTAAALLISFFHLGSPLKAVNALNNLSSSWLSREILAAVLFLFLLMVWIFLIQKRNPSDKAAKIVVGAAILTGLFLILAMSFLYMLPGVLSWDFFTTPLSFFTSAFLLGFMAAGVLSLVDEKSISPSIHKEINPSSNFHVIKTVLNITFALASIQIFVSIILSLRLQNWSSLYSPFESNLFYEHGLFFFFRIAFMLAGMVLILLVLTKMRPKKNPHKIPGWLIYPAFSLILISEIMSRHLFYAIYFRNGL